MEDASNQPDPLDLLYKNNFISIHPDLWAKPNLRLVFEESGDKAHELGQMIRSGMQVGCAQSTVVEALQVIGKVEDSTTKPITPSHITERHAIADFEKLSPEGQERVRQKEPLNRVALEEGVRQPPDHLKLAKSHFLKMTAEQRTAFDEWRSRL